MSDEIKTCSNCSKKIAWEKEGDKYYRIEEIKGVMVENQKFVCPSCWESKKDDYATQLKAKMKEGEVGVSRMTKGITHYDGGGTSHQRSLYICQGCDKWKEEDNHSCKGKNNQSREREREQKSHQITQIKQYFQANNIKSIRLEGNKLIFEYNDLQTETKIIDNQELQQIQVYCQQKGVNTLSFSDLQQSTQKPQGFNWKSPWVMGGGIVLVVGIVGLVIYLLNRNKKEE